MIPSRDDMLVISGNGSRVYEKFQASSDKSAISSGILDKFAHLLCKLKEPESIYHRRVLVCCWLS